MRLATLADGSRDGKLIVVASRRDEYVAASNIAPTLQMALDNWDKCEPALQLLAQQLNSGQLVGDKIDVRMLASPLPRAYEWVDGSAFLHHVRLVRKARGAELPATLLEDPLVYQGGSGHFLAPTSDINIINSEYGYDFEAEVCVVLADTPLGTSAAHAHAQVRLFMLVNDVSLRGLIPAELAKGFGFFISKPASAFSPYAVTADELGDSWREGRVHLPLLTKLNGKQFGNPNAGVEMHFSFADLIAHISKTRAFTAGTIVGSGTVSNSSAGVGSSCLMEKRMLETIATGKASTPFLQRGDRVEIEMCDADGRSVFGKISQACV
ncbi:MAG: fumarylacetoacetate hydrolase family protein [Pseudomonadota bacterium]|nr:fumarylacetoacetate hydrolase family protein [Pseudomonadota bacterium]